MNECADQIQGLLTWTTYVVLAITAGGVGLIWNAGRGPTIEPPKRPGPASTYELCKLHQRPTDQCRDMHKDDLDGPSDS